MIEMVSTLVAAIAVLFILIGLIKKESKKFYFCIGGIISFAAAISYTIQTIFVETTASSIFGMCVWSFGTFVWLYSAIKRE